MLFDTLEFGKDNLLGVEKIIRLSICSHDAVFKEEGYLERVRRLSVYRRILALLIFQQIKGWFFAVDIEKTKLVELQGCLAKYPNQKEDCFQFSIVFIQEAISHLLKSTKKSKNSNVRAFLNECQANIETQGDDSEELSFLRKLKNPEWVKKMKRNNNKNKWLAVHCVILYLYEKVSETLLSACNYCNTGLFWCNLEEMAHVPIYDKLHSKSWDCMKLLHDDYLSKCFLPILVHDTFIRRI